MRDAINEFIVNDAIEERGDDPLFTGPMQCFCQNEKKTKHKKAEIYELKDDGGNVIFSDPICLRYRNDQFLSKMLALSVTVIVVGVNVILKLIVVKLVGWVG